VKKLVKIIEHKSNIFVYIKIENYRKIKQ